MQWLNLKLRFRFLSFSINNKTSGHHDGLEVEIVNDNDN